MYIGAGKLKMETTKGSANGGWVGSLVGEEIILVPY